jgi:hypothetical protein
MPPGWLCETTSLLIGGAAVGSGIMGGTRRAHKPQRLRLQWRTYVSTAALVTSGGEAHIARNDPVKMGKRYYA